MLNIGLLGVTPIGIQHAKAIQNVKDLQLCGISDLNAKKAKKFAKELNVPFFDDPQKLINYSDALDITTATDFINSFIPLSLKASRHLFLTPEVLNYKQMGENLIKLSTEAKAKIQIGYTARFHSALLATFPIIKDPLLIDIKHNIAYSKDLSRKDGLKEVLTNDLDIIFSVIKANIKKIQAGGTAVFGEENDVVNVHLEFDNGANVFLNINYIASQNRHYFQFFKKNVQVDCDLEHQTYKIYDQKEEKLEIYNFKSPHNHPLTEAFRAFHNAITFNSEPIVGVTEGCLNINTTRQIIDKINFNNRSK